MAYNPRNPVKQSSQSQSTLLEVHVNCYFIMWMQHELHSGMKLIQEWKSLRYNIISPLIWPLLCDHLFKEDIVTL